MWRWDGQRWVPAVMVAPPKRSKAWIWWLAGAVTVSLVLLLVGVGYGVYSIASKFQASGFSCLPADFPRYPGTRLIEEQTTLGSALPGDSKQCRMTLISSDDVTVVGPYFQNHLASGDWTVMSTDYNDGSIHFQRSSKPQTIGTVQLLHLGQQTEIRIVLDS